MNENMILYKFVKHFITISKHKILVGKYCFKLGLYKQGLTHDISKYYPIEFFAGVKYYQGYRSPIDKEKEELGYSKAWLHHKGRNMHHWEYWYDNKKDGYVPIEMPLEYLCEMICDRVAASKIYLKDNYKDDSAYLYFMNNLNYTKMHENTIAIVKELLGYIKDNGEEKGFQMIKEYMKKNRK